MTGPASRVVVAIALSLASQPPQPTFRAQTELVRVDVLVTNDGVPVAGLSAEDFDVRDDGIRQRVAAVRAVESVRLGVVLDASGSMTGERLEMARAATTELLGQLNAGDRLAIVVFGDQVARIVAPGSSPAEAVAALPILRAAGGTALVDALHAGILEADDGPGPKLLLAMTDGRNNTSWLDAADVIDVARRHETVIYPIGVGVERNWTAGVAPRLRTSDGLALLQILAEQTGGRHIVAAWDGTLGTVFRQILTEYRQRYILAFTPEGVPRGGWHRLDVRVKRRGVTVRARTRYWAGDVR